MRLWVGIDTDGMPERVTELELRNKRLPGPIPVELGNLTGLTTLFLNNNNLSGSIPPELGDLTNLTELDLSRNQLDSGIPSNLFDVDHLDRLIFDYDENATGPAIVLSPGAPTQPWWTHDGLDMGQMAVDRNDGSLTFKRPPDYEIPVDSNPPDNVYQVTVYADDFSRRITSQVTLVIVVRDVDEPPEKPAAPSVRSAATDRLTVRWIAPANTGPAITGYDVEYRKSGTSAWRTHNHVGAGTSTTISGLDPGAGYEMQVKARNEEGESQWSNVGTGSTSAPANLAPVFPGTESGTRSVAENTAPGTNIGAPVQATDVDTLRYTLRRIDEASFHLVAGTGQLQTKTALDHEARLRYIVEVTATDPSGLSATIPVAIDVTDVDEAPGKPAAPTIQSAGTDWLNVGWNAPANTGPAINGYGIEYREMGTSTWSPLVDVGTETSITIAGLDQATNYEVRVLARNSEGVSAPSDAVVGSTAAVRAEVKVFFDSAAYSATEDGGAVTVTVVLSQAADRAISIPVQITAGSAEPTDYDVADRNGIVPLTFAPGAASQRLLIGVNADADLDDESVIVSFGTLPAGVSSADPGVAVVTITDTSAPPSTPAPTPEPTVEPTPAPTPTSALAPTAEPVPTSAPAPTAEPVPTSAPAPTAEPAPTPTVEPTPPPVVDPEPSPGGGVPLWVVIVVVIGVIAIAAVVFYLTRVRNREDS